MTNARPGRPRAVIAPLATWPEAPALVSRMAALLDQLKRVIDDEVRTTAAPPLDPTRVPLNERAALNVADTAIYLDVSVETVRRLKRKGHLVPLSRSHFGDRVLFARSAVDAFVAASHDAAMKEVA